MPVGTGTLCQRLKGLVIHLSVGHAMYQDWLGLGETTADATSMVDQELVTLMDVWVSEFVPGQCKRTATKQIESQVMLYCNPWH